MNIELKQKILNNPSKYFSNNELILLNKKIYPLVKEKIKLDNKSRIYVFTDGSVINNGKQNCKGGYAIFFGHNHPNNRSIKVNGNVTNNQMELLAIYECLKLLDSTKKYIIVCDSEYCIKSVTVWYKKWMENNWITSYGQPVKNKNIIVKIIELLKKKDVHFYHVNSHKPEPEHKNTLEYKLWYGNKLVDKMAKS